ncbi:hypothetical protein DFH06DRAFT_513625 [Mycena polygramma]|nr:hypothetical protein DFH06DRAFT_513625 [Mycena polygramma]
MCRKKSLRRHWRFPAKPHSRSNEGAGRWLDESGRRQAHITPISGDGVVEGGPNARSFKARTGNFRRAPPSKPPQGLWWLYCTLRLKAQRERVVSRPCPLKPWDLIVAILLHRLHTITSVRYLPRIVDAKRGLPVRRSTPCFLATISRTLAIIQGRRMIMRKTVL